MSKVDTLIGFMLGLVFSPLLAFGFVMYLEHHNKPADKQAEVTELEKETNKGEKGNELLQ
jgi:hypothetical protein